MNTSLSHPITEDDIVDFLTHTPDFFERHAELLATIQLSSPHGNRAVSLQERQAEMLRDKIRALEHRVMAMIRNVNENVILSDRMLRWACKLFLATDLAALPGQIAEDIASQFSVPQVGIKVWGVAPAFADADFAKGVSEDGQLFASSLMEPFCGINAGLEAVSWLPDAKAATSLAILPLRHGPAGSTAPAFGMLVLASPDSQRFTSAMGTDFLERVAELASAALSRLK
jgi:uncharacterized protein YigA (DUF484 family)